MSADGPLKVSTKSSPNAVAGALAAALRERGSAELQAVGAGAINQAIKAVAIARNYLKTADIDLICVPSFITVAISDNERTGISLVVERRPAVQPAQEPVSELLSESSNETNTMLPTETLA